MGGVQATSPESEAAPETAPAEAAAMSMSLSQMVVRLPVAEGVTLDAAIESMLLRANALNMKQVAHQPMWREFEAQGFEKIRRVEIFQFCNIAAAHEMLNFNIDFVAFMPCRIAAIEDNEGKPFLVMMNLDLLLSLSNMPDELAALAKKVRDDLMEIIQAGAEGEL
ncbi:hypothetical protein TPSD3_16070 [Thioflexithrix psekupsensis]|uniref:DUF302 domain-containing protein n=2 Tax=Thioflexithrix psekupsensis TaxID=1570016 RepID=A0A251X660_9GAMM|nr:hypothetical protein TPSD3_16070 [Thioflexithrix psekupsensis]